MESQWERWFSDFAPPSKLPAQFAETTRRLIVVAPHPDDEVIGMGGMLADLVAAGRAVFVVAVTDGDASHPPHARWKGRRIRDVRVREREEGLRRLALPGCRIHRLRIPDGEIARYRPFLVASLKDLVGKDDCIVATWRSDGHPDHDATGAAAAYVAHTKDVPFAEIPIWMWHWAHPADARVPWHRLARIAVSGDAQARKLHALAAHRSQLTIDSVTKRPPILPPTMLARAGRPWEALLT